MQQQPTTTLGRLIDNIEETSIAICLGLMTLITFANVVARYVFADNILWALELTVFLFAWLVLMGMSYGVKKHVHLGVDVLINAVPPGTKKLFAMLSVVACLAFSILLLVGAWNYWYPFATERVWLETDDIPMLDGLRFIEPWLNENEAYEKLPRFIPYIALPLGVALLTLRFVQQAWLIFTGQVGMLIASHEAEDMMQEMQAKEAANNGKEA